MVMVVSTQGLPQDVRHNVDGWGNTDLTGYEDLIDVLEEHVQARMPQAKPVTRKEDKAAALRAEIRRMRGLG